MSKHKKIKSTAKLLLLCLLILVSSILFLFIAQNEPMIHWVKTFMPSVSSANSQVSQPESLPESATESSLSIEKISKVWEKDSNLVLVNWEYALPEHYEPKLQKAFDMEMDERLVEPYSQMIEAASKEGITFWISSAYRAPELQKELLEREIKENEKKGMSSEEAREKAAAAVAKPGHSEHNTGLAIDLNGVRADFEHEKGYAWLQQHAAEYGFILRYPKEEESKTRIMFEPWHYRYVGKENALKMKELGMCLEEYVKYLALKEENN